MPLDERRARHDALIKVLSENDVKHWGERFVTTLTQPAGTPSAPLQPIDNSATYLAAAE